LCSAYEIKNGQKIFPTHPAGHSRDLPTDNKLAEWLRNKFSGRSRSSCALFLSGKLSASSTTHLPEGEGVGGSLPDSIIVGRIGPTPSRFVLRDCEWRDGLLCSIGVSLFAGLGV